MYLIEVIPISRGIGSLVLSYFSAEGIPLGSIVSVPLRKKTVHGLVVSSSDARESRSEIRSSDFTIRKVSEFKAEKFLSEGFMRAVKSTAFFFASSIGSSLAQLVPKFALDVNTKSTHSESLKKSGVFDRLVLQSDDSERYANYRMLIREEFARKKSVFFCVPTAEDAKRAQAILSKGIEDYTVVLYGSMAKKKFRDSWDKAHSSEHPVLIIATGNFLSIYRDDLSLLILEGESSRAYKMLVRPYIDIRVFAEYFAKECGMKFIVGDALLRTETIYRFKQGDFSELTPLKFRSLSTATHQVVDMRSIKKKGSYFESISPELHKLIEASHTSNQNLFLFASRRGLSPLTVCGDCGATAVCSRCQSPITLHTSSSNDGVKNIFLCHACGEKRTTDERCAHCQSWKLTPLGVGIELVDQELLKKFPTLKVFRIDKDTASTSAKATKIVGDFYQSPGSVLLGTEMSLAYLDKRIDNTAVVSLDSLFSLPDFRVHERILHILLKIRSLSLSGFLVQTRLQGENVLEYAVKGNLADFYREEIAERETFGYPPFTVLIKISLAGNRLVVVKEMDKLAGYFAPFEFEKFSAYSENAKGTFTMHGLIRLSRGAWVNADLHKRLVSLPLEFRVVVEPDSLL